jgi:hypothetical protein
MRLSGECVLPTEERDLKGADPSARGIGRRRRNEEKLFLQ